MNGEIVEEEVFLRPSKTPRNNVSEEDSVDPRRFAVPDSSQAYNIVPDDNIHHPACNVPELKTVILALGKIQRLRWLSASTHRNDIFDWLQSVFKFQVGNVRNQREHLVLLLSNAQMRLKSREDSSQELKAEVITSVCEKLTDNYTSWCKFHHIKKNFLEGKDSPRFQQVELLYSALYLLIWGEAANVRFMPECLCYIFHHMAGEMNALVTDSALSLDMNFSVPMESGAYGFLEYVIQPLYNIIRAEAVVNEKGDVPHYAWRNYDDMNEYFWNKHCFKTIGWPLDQSSSYFLPPDRAGKKVGKTGFVEQRSFLHLFCSFDRIWVLLVLMFQALTLIAFDAEASGRTPWMQVVQSRDTVAGLLSCFITWAFLRFLLAFITSFLQWRLMKWSTPLVAIRMLLKFLAAGFWVIWFAAFYATMWTKRNSASSWDTTADTYFRIFLASAAVFCIPQGLGLLMSLVPWLSRFVETSDWRIFTLATWWFQSHLFVGRGLFESTFDTIRYSLFWIVLLAGKFAFSYFQQIKPLVSPTKLLMELNVVYRWPKFDSGNNLTAVLCLWVPTVLVYAMDIQIWYAILSSVVGLLVGLFQHIGEARNTKFLLLRFQVLPKAVQFNLLASTTNTSHRPSWWSSVKRNWGQFQLRYKILQSRTVSKNEEGDEVQTESTQFAQLWNGIMDTFREEDLISNRELELLTLPRSHPSVSVQRWPVLLLANELMRAVDLSKDWKGSSKSLWQRLRGKEYRRCAVIEGYELLKFILLGIVAADQERNILKVIFEMIDNRDTQKETSKYLRLKSLPKVRGKVTELLNVLSKRPGVEGTPGVEKALQNLHEAVVRDLFTADAQSLLQTHNVDVFLTSSVSPIYFKAVELPDATDHSFYSQVTRLLTIINTNTPMLHVPANLEARRRISFFCNSVFMDMPSAPPIEYMRSFSVLTPYYNETVAYTKKDLTTENEDGISDLFYLQKIYPDEWKNLVERVGGGQPLKEHQMWQNDEGKDICMWASYRGQTLTRTVRGMMYYRKALEMQALLEGEGGSAVSEALGAIGEEVRRTDGRARPRRAAPPKQIPVDSVNMSAIRTLCNLKYTYVVACQIYGVHKKEGDQKAAAILELMKKYEALRVAYVDEVKDKGVSRLYSVLVKWDPVEEREQEVYRVMLPGPMKLGEGKPENQNHAIIFTRGDALQTIDMNQDGYLEEALKLRNVLQEFDHHSGARKPTILGIREHVFTGSVSSLAGFMSSQEMAFVTLGQRVLANPLKVRMHYGHPDIFDRLWFITRGGISKASRVINISEDIYAGFNCTLRGGSVTHHEYLQLGKGRDVGLNQIVLFEAKVASGNGEQTLSRDVHRLGHRLDFFRALSFFYTTVGYYMCTMLTAITVYTFLWGRCYLALSGVEAVLALDSNTFTQEALIAVLNQQFLVQIGVFTALPMILEYTLEFGFLAALWDFFMMQLQLASVFFTFSLGTRTHYYSRTVLHGGAKYRATGRGFVVKHEKFLVNYRMYARSHFVKGVELMTLLVIYQCYTSLSSGVAYYLLTIASWFLALTWLMAPFVFNPSGFDWLKMVEDWKEFSAWISRKGGKFVSEKESWEVWWKEENSHLRRTGFWGLVAESIYSLRFFLCQFGIIYQLKVTDGNTSILMYLYSWAYLLILGLTSGILAFFSYQFRVEKHIRYRAVQMVVFLLVIGIMIGALFLTNFAIIDILASAIAFLPTGWGILLLSQVLVAAYPPLENTSFWSGVTQVARIYEYMLGVIVALPVAILSWLPGLQDMQTRILFNQAFSRGLQISRILVGKKPNAGY